MGRAESCELVVAAVAAAALNWLADLLLAVFEAFNRATGWVTG